MQRPFFCHFAAWLLRLQWFAMTSKKAQIDQLHHDAQAALQRGDLRHAHQQCLAILQQDTRHADAWFICGLIAAHNKQPKKALEIINKAIENDPGNAEYQAQLARQYIALRDYPVAADTARAALELHPRSPVTLNTIGVVLSHAGEHEQALQCFQAAMTALNENHKSRQLAPGQAEDWLADFHFNFGAALKFAGRFDEAATNYERAITLNPELYKAHSALAQLQTQTPASNHLKRLDGLRNRVTDAHGRLHIGHALAKEQEDLGQYAASLQSLAWAKQGQAQKCSYRFENDLTLFTAITRLFGADSIFPRDTRLATCNSRQPIFVVGMPRTGTTLVEQILGSHTSVHAAGERQDFPLLVKRLTKTASADVIDEPTLAASVNLDPADLGGRYVEATKPPQAVKQLSRASSAPLRVVDKLPLNFLYLGLIKRVLPNARLICLRRDPMDTCLSNYRQQFATRFRYYHYNYSLQDCGRYFIAFDALIRHWQTVMPEAVYEVDYEQLVAHPEAQARALLDYCELPWESGCLDFHRRDASVATASAVQVRQPIYRTSVNRWQRYGDALQPLYQQLRSAGFYC